MANTLAEQKKPHTHNHLGSAAGRNKGRLYSVLALTGAFLIAEVIGGLLTNSLALLADAGHMLTDVLGLIMALIAIRLGERPATDKKTFGYYRTEILAALLNAVILILVALYVLYEAVQRFADISKVEVAGSGMLIVAALGLTVNVISLFILRQASGESLNMRGAYLEVLGDMLGSVGAIVGALIIIFTGWMPADPIIGIGIGLFIVPRAISLLREAVDVLLEGTPKDIALDDVRTVLEGLPTVIRAHDIHIWSITSSMYAMSGHLQVTTMNECTPVLNQAQQVLHDRFAIEHCTIQLETADFTDQSEMHP